MAIALESFEKAVSRTTGFFKGPEVFRKWLKMSVILFIFAVFTGQGLSSGNSFDFLNQIPMDQQPANFFTPPNFGQQELEAIISIIVVAVVLLIVLGFFMKIVGNAAFFASLEAIESGEPKISSIKNYLSKGLNLAVLELFLGLLVLPFAIAFIIGVLGLILSFLPKNQLLDAAIAFVPLIGQISNFPTALMLAIIGFVGIVFFMFLNYFLRQFGVYIMFRDNKGAFTSFREGIATGLHDLGELAILIIFQVAIGIGIGIGVMVVSLLLFIPMFLLLIPLIIIAIASLGNIAVLALVAIAALAISLVVAFVGTFILAPVYVFIFSYNLEVLDAFRGKREWLL